jgi:hypothetical protein
MLDHFGPLAALAVELIGFFRRKATRDTGRSYRLPARLAPPPGVATHGLVTAVIAAPAQFFEDPDQRELLASGFGRIAASRPSSSASHRPSFGPGWTTRSYSKDVSLDLSNLPDRVPRHLQATGYRRASELGNRTLFEFCLPKWFRRLKGTRVKRWPPSSLAHDARLCYFDKTKLQRLEYRTFEDRPVPGLRRRGSLNQCNDT